MTTLKARLKELKPARRKKVDRRVKELRGQVSLHTPRAKKNLKTN